MSYQTPPGKVDNESYECKSPEQCAKELGFKDFADFMIHSRTGAQILAMTPEQRQMWHDNSRKRFLSVEKR